MGTGRALDLIDLGRYPIHDLDSPAGRKLVDACRHDLDSTAVCVLPGFVHEGARAAMVAEATAVLPETVHIQRPRTSYGWMNNGGFPPDHPRSALHQQNQGNLYGDQIGEGLMKQLFDLDELTEFVRRALGFDTLYVSADPVLALMVGVMDEGEQLGWHFDTNDGVVSLLLQAPEVGGQFEYAPFIRSEDDENYDEVGKLFSGNSSLAVQPGAAAGSFVLFRGRRSCHRVTPVVIASQPRLNLLLSYDEKPGMVFPAATVASARYPTNEPFVGVTP